MDASSAIHHFGAIASDLLAPESKQTHIQQPVWDSGEDRYRTNSVKNLQTEANPRKLMKRSYIWHYIGENSANCVVM